MDTIDTTTRLVAFCRTVMSDNDFNIYASQSGLKSEFRQWARTYHPDKGGDQQLFITIQQCKEIMIQHFDTMQFFNAYPFLSNTMLLGLVNFCLSLVSFAIGTLINQFIYSLIFRLLFGILYSIQYRTIALPIWLKAIIFKQPQLKKVSTIIKKNSKRKTRSRKRSRSKSSKRKTRSRH